MKSFLIFLLISAGLFVLIFSEYYDHFEAFENQATELAIVVNITCSKRSSLEVRTRNASETEYVSLLRDQCRKMKLDSQVILLRGKSGKLYWNEAPTDRIFWFIPIYLILAGFMIFRYFREKHG